MWGGEGEGEKFRIPGERRRNRASRVHRSRNRPDRIFYRVPAVTIVDFGLHCGDQHYITRPLSLVSFSPHRERAPLLLSSPPKKKIICTTACALDATYAGRASRQLPSSPPGRSPLTRANDHSSFRSFHVAYDSTLLSLILSFPPGERDHPREWGQHTIPMVSQVHMLFHMSCGWGVVAARDRLQSSVSASDEELN